MPVDLLLVEGELDAVIVASLFAPQVTVERGGSKSSLKPKTCDRRKDKKINICYLRDRDFDFDPPSVVSEPTVDATDDASGSGGPILGWRWCRHETENYLLEPQLVEAALGWREADYVPSLLAAAQKIRCYTAARWAVGTARRGVLRVWELATRPADLTNQYKVPQDCSERACFDWARDHVAKFLAAIQHTLAPSAVDASLSERSERLAAISTVSEVLLWHSGKDLLAALGPNLPSPARNQPKVFLRMLRDWVRRNPEKALAIFPEWQALKTALQTA
jgi:hypothetical protein